MSGEHVTILQTQVITCTFNKMEAVKYYKYPTRLYWIDVYEKIVLKRLD